MKPKAQSSLVSVLHSTEIAATKMGKTIRLNLSSTLTAALYFYTMAYGLQVNEDEWAADICCSILDVSTLAFILLAMCKPVYKNTVLPSR